VTQSPFSLPGYEIYEPSSVDFTEYLTPNNLILSRFINALKTRIKSYFNMDTAFTTLSETVNVWITAPDIDPTKPQTLIETGLKGSPQLGIIVRFVRHSLEPGINMTYMMNVECSIQFVLPHQENLEPQELSSVKRQFIQQPTKYMDVTKNILCDGMYLALSSVPVPFIDRDGETRHVIVTPTRMETVEPLIPLMHVTYSIPVAISQHVKTVDDLYLVIDVKALHERTITTFS
jgi:hypothetical protein